VIVALLSHAAAGLQHGFILIQGINGVLAERQGVGRDIQRQLGIQLLQPGPVLTLVVAEQRLAELAQGGDGGAGAL